MVGTMRVSFTTSHPASALTMNVVTIHRYTQREIVAFSIIWLFQNEELMLNCLIKCFVYTVLIPQRWYDYGTTLCKVNIQFLPRCMSSCKPAIEVTYVGQVMNMLSKLSKLD